MYNLQNISFLCLFFINEKHKRIKTGEGEKQRDRERITGVCVCEKKGEGEKDGQTHSDKKGKLMNSIGW